MSNSNKEQPQTSDFMSFGNEQAAPNTNRFSPASYSSPTPAAAIPLFYQNFEANSSPNPNQNRNRQWPNSNRNRSFYNNSSPNNSNRSFNSSYNTPNRSFNRNNRGQNRSFNNSGHFKARQDHNNLFNKQLFLHPSFMENPWAQLEAQLQGQGNSDIGGSEM